MSCILFQPISIVSLTPTTILFINDEKIFLKEIRKGEMWTLAVIKASIQYVQKKKKSKHTMSLTES